MRLSNLSIGELFFLAFTREARELKLGLAQPKTRSVPKGTELVGFTTDGKNRYTTEHAAIEASWMYGRRAFPVPVFSTVRPSAAFHVKQN